MKFLVVFSCVLAVAFAKPGYLGYAAILPGAPLGADGRVVDTAEVSLAKAEHAAAHINEKLTLNKEALRSTDYLVAAAPLAYAAPAAPLAYASAPAYAASLAYAHAPAATILAADGRPLDTAEVAIAKASHAAAHLNERLIHAHEATRNLAYY
ncbi:cuticle protein 2-like [Nasonia vitripennis]|uniref:Cuticle protein 18.7-like n=1 Tax=Nasonia vitripennis TaxID=7425 RepID=A0A7M7G2G3_NASVI|nr:cuticle protein 2-like [Nasonia vitripennis]